MAGAVFTCEVYESLLVCCLTTKDMPAPAFLNDSDLKYTSAGVSE